MTFESGTCSKRVLEHVRRGHCDATPCAKPDSHCVRKFFSVNSANRHTYCYSLQQVQLWDRALCVAAVEDVGSLQFSNLTLDEALGKILHFAGCAQEGPPYEISDLVSIDELFVTVGARMGDTFSREKLECFREEYKRRGFGNAGMLRVGKCKRGDWEFLHNEFQEVDASVEGVAHIVKYLVCKPQSGRGYSYS